RTHYVVTGCDIRGATEFAYDNEDKKVTVPVGYFKALLGYKKSGGVGISPSTGGYTGAGFYFEHKSYSNNRSTILGLGMTIDELEEKMGMDFFVNLPAAIGATYADKVESTMDSYWTK
ncbi:MAG: DNA/RNA non-specific endonuclease, partial [Bacteroidales bacterium]|nr:DNA/RNA non-specific endonuclease [Bacteroidales bacterium]